MTNGMKSTEFWLTLVGIAVGVYLASTGASVQVIGAVVAPIAAYGLSRGLAKKS